MWCPCSKMPPSPLLLLFPPLLLVLLISTPASPTANLCSSAGLCCRHRDSGCVVQHVFPNKSIDTSELPCYCDQACLRLDDCCPDYREFCSGRDTVKSLLWNTIVSRQKPVQGWLTNCCLYCIITLELVMDDL